MTSIGNCFKQTNSLSSARQGYHHRHRRAANELSDLTRETFYELQRSRWWYKRRFRTLLDCTSETILDYDVSVLNKNKRKIRDNKYYARLGEAKEGAGKGHKHQSLFLNLR